MAHKHWLALVLTLTLIGSAQAKEPKVDTNLLLWRLNQMVHQQKYDQLVDLVVRDPARAEQLMRKALEQGARHPQWLNANKEALIALALILEKRLGHPEFTQQLQARGLSLSDPTLSNYLQSVAGDTQELWPLDLSLRVGNYRTALQLLDKLQRKESLFAVLRVVALESSGQLHRAVREAQALLDSLPPQDPQRGYATMALVAAARASHQTALVDLLLPPLLQAARRGDTDSARLACFTLESWGRPRATSLPELLQNHERIWKLFPSQRLGDLKPGDGRWACQASREWISDLVDQVRTLDPKSPQYSEISQLIEADLKTLYAQAQPKSQGDRDLQMEFVFGLFDASLDCLEALIQSGHHEEAEKFLKLMNPFVGLAQLGVVNFEKRLKAQATLSQGPVPVSVSEGEFSRSLARFQQTWARLLLVTNKPRNQIQQRLDQAAQAEELAHRGVGFRGLEEVAFDRVEFLLRYQPAQAAQPLAELVQQCQQLQYSPGLVQALSWQARLPGAPARALLEQARTLLETGVVPDGGLATRWRFTQAASEVYQQLARLEFEAGKPEQAFASLNQGKEVERLGQSQELRLRAQQVAALEQEAVQLQQHGAQDAATQQKLASSKSEFVALARQLRTPNSAVNPLDLTRFQTLLPEGALVLQILPGPQETYLLSVTSKSFRADKVKLGETDLNRKVLHCRAAIQKQDLAASQADLAYLYQQLLGPLQKELEQARVLLVIPSGTLHYLPFQALGHKQDGKFVYLIERFPVVVLSKSSDFLCLSSPPPALKGSMVAVGNPDGSLPGAEVEARQVAALFSPAQLYTGDQALARRLQSMPADVEVLHMATHGVLNPYNPEESYLLLAGGSHLDARQIMQLPLSHARLVTLSACQTALGENHPGREVTSLAESFWAAGTVHTACLCSLWQVADEPTRQLMLALYQGLRQKKLPLGEAFRQAQLELLHQPATSNPFYWAAFTLWGDWR